MAEKIRPCYHLIENAKAAAEEIGLKPLIVPVRGGTDGAQLSFRGLPCPDIGTGGYAYHCRTDYQGGYGFHCVLHMIFLLFQTRLYHN